MVNQCTYYILRQTIGFYIATSIIICKSEARDQKNVFDCKQLHIRKREDMRLTHCKNIKTFMGWMSFQVCICLCVCVTFLQMHGKILFIPWNRFVIGNTSTICFEVRWNNIDVLTSTSRYLSSMRIIIKEWPTYYATNNYEMLFSWPYQKENFNSRIHTKIHYDFFVTWFYCKIQF